MGLLLLLLLLLVVFDFSYTIIYKNSTPRTKFQYVRSLKNTKVNYVFLGSSRVENGIDPTVIERETNKSCLNLGYEAAKLGDIYTMLKLLKTYAIATDTVFIQVDYIFDIKGHSINLPYQMTPFIQDSPVIKDYLIEYTGAESSMYYVPFIRYLGSDQKIGFREVFANLIGKQTKVIANKGFSPLGILGNKSKHESHFSLPPTIQWSNSYYEKIKEYAARHDIKIVFFCAPFCRHTKNLNYIKKLKVKIPELYDFSDAIQADPLFVDCFHLNEVGAADFTTIFTATVLKNHK